MRRLLENVTRKLVVKRRLPDAFGRAPVYVSPSAGLRFLSRPLSGVDPSLLRNALDVVRAGNVVWDIGANVGLFTYAAASLVGPSGRVFAFEPDTWLVGLLRHSARVQPKTSGRVTVVPAAVAAKTELRAFQIAKRARASNALDGYGLSQMGGAAETQTVVTLALDWLAANLPKPDVIKCDVEGAEGEVFGQASALFRQSRPVVLCEVSDPNRQTIADVFGKADYVFYDAAKPLAGATPISGPAWATIAIPRGSEAAYCRAH